MTTALPTLAAQVLTDRDLFRRVTAFQRGLAMPLVAFWRRHSPRDEPLRLTRATAAGLVETLTEHGTPELFDMAKRATFSTFAAGISRAKTPELMKLSFFHVAWAALGLNRPDIVQWALASKSSDLPHDRESDREDFWLDVLLRCAEDGDPRMAEVLKTFAPLETRKLNALVDTACYRITEEKLLRWLRWLTKAFPGVEIPRDMVRLATRRGDLPMLQFLHAHGHTTFDPSAFRNVVDARRFDMLAFLLDHFPGSLTEHQARELVEATDPEVQQLAVRFSEQFQAGFAMAISCAAGDSALARVQAWAARGLISPRWPISIDAAAATGNARTVRFLHEQGIAIATTEAMDGAAEQGHWKLVKFLHENRSEGCTTRALDAAIKQSKFELLTLLYENRTEGCSLHAVEATASHRSLEVLQFLHLHTDAAFAPSVMDKAAAHGNLTMVKFLHKNRSEGCTTDAMDHAAANGHLRVVEFLHAHRQEGCTFAAVREALQKGLLPIVHFLFDTYRGLFELDTFDQEFVTSIVRSALEEDRRSVVQFLFGHFPHLFAREILHDALLYGAFDIYTTLQYQCPDNTDATITSALYEAGRSMELPTIRFIVNVLGRRDVAYRAMDGAASNLRNGRAWYRSTIAAREPGSRRNRTCLRSSRCGTDWLRAVYAVTGPESCRLSAVRLASAQVYGNRLLDSVKYLIRVCCEPNAKQVAIEASTPRCRRADSTNWASTTEDEDQDALPLHPFLLDPRVKTWAVDRLLDCDSRPRCMDGERRVRSDDPSLRDLTPLTWAVQAVYEHDVSLLEVIRETPVAPWRTHACHGGTPDADLLSFEGARAAAVRIGDLPILQWLMEKIDLPVEPTLLQEAVYYDQREIALWLVEHHPKACVKVHSSFIPDCPDMTEDQLDWLEANTSVREALDFGRIVVTLIECWDANAVRRVHAWYPDLLRSVPGLLGVAKKCKNVKVVTFLEEIGYDVSE